MKTKCKNIIIGVVATIVLGLSCYLIYNKYKVQEDDIDVKVVDDDKKIKEDLINIIKEYGLDALAYEEKDIVFKEEPRNSQLYLIASYYEKNKNKDYAFTREELDDYYEKVYGVKPKSYPNIKCMTDKEDLYIYEDNKYIFNKNHPGHGYYGPGFIDSFITEYQNNDKEYTIKVLFLHGNEMEGYSVNEDNLFGEEKEDILYNTDGLKKYFKDNINKFLDKTKYQYTFEKDSGRYILKSFKKVK